MFWCNSVSIDACPECESEGKGETRPSSWEKTFANVINCNGLAYKDDPDNS